jgi:hypothetical protein
MGRHGGSDHCCLTCCWPTCSPASGRCCRLGWCGQSGCRRIRRRWWRFGLRGRRQVYADSLGLITGSRATPDSQFKANFAWRLRYWSRDYAVPAMVGIVHSGLVRNRGESCCVTHCYWPASPSPLPEPHPPRPRSSTLRSARPRKCRHRPRPVRERRMPRWIRQRMN